MNTAPVGGHTAVWSPRRLSCKRSSEVIGCYARGGGGGSGDGASGTGSASGGGGGGAGGGGDGGRGVWSMRHLPIVTDGGDWVVAAAADASGPDSPVPADRRGLSSTAAAWWIAR